MRSPDDAAAFDAFYADARDRLLAQACAVTGDVGAARAGVRDAFVQAWQRWPKVARSGHPESVVRPEAVHLAVRRRTARVGRHDRVADPDLRAIVDALQHLSTMQRRVLVLAHLADVTLTDLAREVGLTRAAAERELQSGTDALALDLGIAASGVPAAVGALRDLPDGRGWPRATQIRRAGTARRRQRTALGVAATVVALLLSGVAVGAPAGPGGSRGVAPSLGGETVDASAGAGARGPVPELGPGDLLAPDQVARLDRRRTWTVARTDGNTEGDGLVLPCQQERFADPDGAAALVRTFSAGGGQGRRAADLTAAQMTELSRSTKQAERAFRTASLWYAGCTAPDVQLLSTARLPGVGDEAVLLQLRTYGASPGTTTVAVARTGRFTTTAATWQAGRDRPSPAPLATLVAAAVNRHCGEAGAGACAAPPRPRATAPLPLPDAPGLLGVVDLPPSTAAMPSWVATEPERPRTNVAATRCDRTSFGGDDVAKATTRTFVPRAAPGSNRVPDAFGLTETAGVLGGPGAARAFVARIRGALARCPDRDLGTDVEQLASRGGAAGELAVWRVTTEISDDRFVRYLMGVVRSGRAVAQVGLTPTGDATLDVDDFVRLVERAGERLPGLL